MRPKRIMSTRPPRARKVRKERRQFNLFVPVRSIRGDLGTIVTGWEVDPGRPSVAVREDRVGFTCHPADLDLALPREALELGKEIY
jgi:hypothetical protein